MKRLVVSDCPRCGTTKITFDVFGCNRVDFQYGWQNWHEVFTVCRHCNKSIILVISQTTSAGVRKGHFNEPRQVLAIEHSLNDFFTVERFISLRDHVKYPAPKFIPPNIAAIFTEGSTCLSVGCWNAAGTMFRQCLDLITKPLTNVNGITNHQRRNLAPRLTWLFENKLLSSDLESLATCIREDGNDGAHDGTLKKEDAMDLLDFTTALLERVYTEPEKIRQAAHRRKERRAIAEKA